MAQIRHILGLLLAALLLAGAVWLWNAYPNLVGQDPFRPWRTTLMTWRIPILALTAFLLLTLLQWIGSKIPSAPNDKGH